MSRSFGTQLQVLGDLDGDQFDEVLLFDPGLPQLDSDARAAFWLLSSSGWSCRGGDVDLPPTAGGMRAFLLPDQDGDGCLDFAVSEEGLFGFPGGLAVYSGANARQLRTIGLQPNEVLRGAWCVSTGTVCRVAWLTRDGASSAIAVHTEGEPPSVCELGRDPLGLVTLERVISLDADKARAEEAFAVIGTGLNHSGSIADVVLLCNANFSRVRGRWEFPAESWTPVVPRRTADGDPLVAILGRQHALLINVADGTPRLDIRIDDESFPAHTACILPGPALGRGKLLLGIDEENLSAGRIDEYPLYVAELRRSIEPRSMDGYGFGHALAVVHAGDSTAPTILVGTDCRMGGCEGSVLIVDPSDGQELAHFSRVSHAQLHLRE